MKKAGALPDFEILSYIESGFIANARPENVQSGSLDLAIGQEIWRIDGVFMPRPGEKLRDALKRRQLFPHSFSSPLEAQVTYYAALEESFRFPGNVYGYVNPKSSTARNFLRAQLVADGEPTYDSLPRGFRGSVGLLITPQSHSVVLEPGLTLCQVRLLDSDTRFDRTRLSAELQRCKLVWRDGRPVGVDDSISLLDVDEGRLLFTVDLSGDGNGVICYRARSLGKAVVLSQIGEHNPADFFEAVAEPPSGELCMRPGELVLLRTRERIRVPPHFVAEVRMMDPRRGNFVAHGAGFIDAGYGWGGEGLPITLEIGGVTEQLNLYHGQPVCTVAVEQMRAPAAKPYGGTYTTPRLLAKQFRT
ncbi:MAG: 2'-deoxycytidine 5'-triphosphate deaminase [Candidatus Ryanbacteria bacterium]|nr:2'-deoxycytidine 5'-triphosphate deaminase [Candidatus Ryanbacteria bacterium]